MARSEEEYDGSFEEPVCWRFTLRGGDSSIVTDGIAFYQTTNKKSTSTASKGQEKWQFAAPFIAPEVNPFIKGATAMFTRTRPSFEV
jgi:hypothetical protein